MLTRGEIYYIMDSGNNTGSEQAAGRPAIIVSNEMCNTHSPVVEVVFLTTRPKTDMPTHVTIRSTAKVSTALCEQITSISVERLGECAGVCTSQEMDAIDKALCISLSLDLSPAPAKESKNNSVVEELYVQLTQARIEKETYQKLYDELIKNILNRGV